VWYVKFISDSEFFIQKFFSLFFDSIKYIISVGIISGKNGNEEKENEEEDYEEKGRRKKKAQALENKITVGVSSFVIFFS
jgi:hypothetical protein